ncbi:MAG TPA: hypothetical protein VD927_02345 [Chryseosolibacter sp.]|nr:hypothetical protein [Chryseosolibacter sp.]
MLYWLWLSLKSRSLVFFTASNPGITMGGMFGESKYDVLKKIPSRYVPKTVRISLPTTTETVQKILHEHGFHVPLVFKPDIGERGFMVRRVFDTQDIDVYLSEVRTDFVVQELVDLPLEFGVFYTRFPDEPRGVVTSVVGKEMLSVTGNGVATLSELIMSKDRARLQWQALKVKFKERLNEIIPAGQNIELVSIGNHCLGTKFLNMNHLINRELSETFDQISLQIDGFYFGRFDLRCASLEDLYQGHVKILELNGCGAEPAHIYQPGFSFFGAVSVLLRHWQNIYVIAKQNKQKGHRFLSLQEARAYYRKFKEATTA